MKKLNPKTKIRKYMESFFGQIVQAYQSAGKTAQAEALTQKMNRLFPGSAASLGRAFQAAYQKQDYPKVIQLGEKIYAAHPNDQMAVMLAQAYIATRNDAKAVRFSKKAAKALGPRKGVDFLDWLARYYVGQRDLARALVQYDQILKAFPGAAPKGWSPQRWAQVRATAYAFRGNRSYVAKDYEGAINNYRQSLKYFPKNEQAYLFIGLSQWRLQQLDLAMESFARATVLNKAGSAKAREYLEQIYKPRHKDSLEGLDKVLAKARQEVQP